MLYWLLYPLTKDYQIFNVLRYITFRTACATLTALLFCFFFGPPMIRWLKSRQKGGQPIREDGPPSHLITKKGTPTMGGALILGAVVVATLLWGDLSDPYVWIVLLVTTGFGILGGLDDYVKLTERSSAGIPVKIKLLLQVALSLAAALWIAKIAPEKTATTLSIPFFKDLALDVGVFFVPFALLVMVGSSNAVNLTDGLDGLAIVPVMICSICFSVIAYLVGNTIFATYLQIPYVVGAGEITVFYGGYGIPRLRGCFRNHCSYYKA
jgi:phospho-N-acetylmuramoyl-pentapeptide-transferase